MQEERRKTVQVEEHPSETLGSRIGQGLSRVSHSCLQFVFHCFLFFLFIGACVLLVLHLPGPKKIDPFEYLDLRFEGVDGEGKAEARLNSDTLLQKNVDATLSFDGKPSFGLSNGQEVTVHANALGFDLEKEESRLQAKTLFLRKTAKTPYPLHCLLELRLTFPKAKTETLYLLALIRSTCWDEDEKTARFSYGSFQGVTIPWSSIAGTSGPETIVGFRDRKEAFNFLFDYDPDHGPLEQTEMSEKPVTYRKP